MLSLTCPLQILLRNSTFPLRPLRRQTRCKHRRPTQATWYRICQTGCSTCRFSPPALHVGRCLQSMISLATKSWIFWFLQSLERLKDRRSHATTLSYHFLRCRIILISSSPVSTSHIHFYIKPLSIRPKPSLYCSWPFCFWAPLIVKRPSTDLRYAFTTSSELRSSNTRRSHRRRNYGCFRRSCWWNVLENQEQARSSMIWHISSTDC